MNDATNFESSTEEPIELRAQRHFILPVFVKSWRPQSQCAISLVNDTTTTVKLLNYCGNSDFYPSPSVHPQHNRHHGYGQAEEDAAVGAHWVRRFPNLDPSTPERRTRHK
ncbi:hypothetical protein V496_01819 [Pseudogymnoascus sp. VKM F-4515 (FW-2607)]|nr:hypothetical protein V496_01819 [Pseudogymnoascus sp. VKM F-4515 (FW-2607)]